MQQQIPNATAVQQLPGRQTPAPQTHVEQTYGPLLELLMVALCPFQMLQLHHTQKPKQQCRGITQALSHTPLPSAVLYCTAHHTLPAAVSSTAGP